MSQQDSQEQAQGEGNKAQETAQGVKDGANLAKNAASGNYLGAAKDAANLEKNKTARRVMVLSSIFPLLAIIIVVVVSGSLLFSIFSAVGDAIQSALDAIKNFFTIDLEGVIGITDEAIDEIIKSIEDLGISLNDLHLMGDAADYDDPDVEEKNKEALRKYIRQFYEAQAVTQTLYTNPTLGEKIWGELYGTVYVQRTKEDDQDLSEVELLEYISYEKIQEKAALKDANIMKYFSIDDDDKLVVANYVQTIIKENGEETKNETVIGLEHIDYKSVISQYTTPMNFLLYLTIVTQNPEFAAAVADLVKDSDIRITILDKVNTDIKEEERNYTVNVKTVKKVEDQSYDDFDTEKQNPYTYEKHYGAVQQTKITETTVITTIPVPVVTYAKTWFSEQTIKYNKKTTPKEEDRYVTDPPINEEEPQIDGEGIVSWITNDVTTVTTNGSIIEYEESERGNVIDKTGEKGDGENSFVGLLDVLFKIPNTNRKESAGGNLVSGAEWFFYLLQKDSNAQNLENIMRHILYKYTENNYGVSDFNFDIFDIKKFTSIGVGVVSPFGTNLSREEFINLAVAYSTNSSYVTYMANYAGDFYDVCTQYNINPALAYAHACLETGYGTSSGCQTNYNYFGYAHYNTSNTEKKYSSPKDSIEDYCKWVIDNSTIGTSEYNANITTAGEYAVGNSKLNGTPDSNIYVLYCRYSYLGDTHISDETSFTSPAGTEYYKENGSDWGTGGRIYIYSMYEQGGLYTGEYATRCGHLNGSDATTVEEKADYVVYTTNQRINIAKAIFGNDCFIGGSGSLVEAAYEVADHFINSGVAVYYAGDSVESATNNGRVVVSGNIQASWDYPIENPNDYGVVCATYVSLALWRAGLIDEATLNQYRYNACTGIQEMLTTSSYASQWQKITSFSELQEGDIVFYPGYNSHVYIYIDGGKCLDENYCVIMRSGSDNRGKLSNASEENFQEAYRYIGK